MVGRFEVTLTLSLTVALTLTLTLTLPLTLTLTLTVTLSQVVFYLSRLPSCDQCLFDELSAEAALHALL